MSGTRTKVVCATAFATALVLLVSTQSEVGTALLSVGGGQNVDINSETRMQASDSEHSKAELGFVQMSVSADDGAWVPAGQPGLANHIQDAKDDEKEATMEEDGLKGHSILSAVGANDDQDDDDAMFVQDKVAEWTPLGQKVKSSYEDQKEHQGEKDSEMVSFMNDGLEGDNLLSAVGMADQMKPKDEAADLGTLRAEDLDFDLV